MGVHSQSVLLGAQAKNEIIRPRASTPGEHLGAAALAPSSGVPSSVHTGGSLGGNSRPDQAPPPADPPIRAEVKGGSIASSGLMSSPGARLEESASATSGVAGATGRRRLLDSDDDSPMRPRGTKKSRLVSDSSDDEVVLGKMHIASCPQSASAPAGGSKPPKPQSGAAKVPAQPVKRTLPGSAMSADRALRLGLCFCSTRAPATVRKGGDNGDSDEDGQENEISMGAFDPKKRNSKDRLVAQFLRRWWYAWPQWPPEDFDYSKELEKRKLKWVSLEEYEDLDDVDKGGYTKVYQISAFPGVFRDPNGNAIDLRPQEGRPCYRNVKQLSELELLQLIAKAIKGQMAALQSSAFEETSIERALQSELEEVESELKQMQRRMDAAKGRA
ncbi:hypothetical protein cyc_06705 [Cyclospora cayetanensis]|uniref:Uncharacterized protein n=1 Tax=Cyclospora cayetanensis TaxID=88456 RepID=A0A1D3CQV8_9EIME|nr:hypothetical protein cyc_06705 [Cyclospora cayetanensis]